MRAASAAPPAVDHVTFVFGGVDVRDAIA